MSLNWREIDAVLEELDLEEGFIQNIVQPDYSSLILEVYAPGKGRTALYFSFKPGATRLHRLSAPVKKRVKLQRFAQMLRARIRGARIRGLEQLPGQRLVELRLGLEGGDLLLWFRLWGNAANAILTDSDGLIIDAFYRRPARGEVSGGRFAPREEQYLPPDGKFQLREHPEAIDFNEYIEAEYRDRERGQELASRRGDLAVRWRRHLAQLEGRLGGAERAIETAEEKPEESSPGDLILANLHRIEKGAEEVVVEDFITGAEVRIALDPRLSARENADRFFQRRRRERRRRERAREELAELTAAIERVRKLLERVESARSLGELEELPLPPVRKRGASPEAAATAPGTRFYSGPWQIVVGRNARESDTILRGWARGNDYWLHARDYPGGHVFIRGQKGKSVPLDVLLDAGNLAVYYSKGKRNGRGDCYYTQVKHLRRAKHGAIGTVLPTQEKNLAVELEEERLNRLLGADG